MGVKGFSKAFASKVTTLKKLKGLTVAVDASVYLYKAALGGASTHTLTDSDGNPTLHLSVILAKVLNLSLCNIGQVWVFDYHEDGYSPPDKELELASRKKKRDEAQRKLNKLNETKPKTKKEQEQEDMFSDEEDSKRDIKKNSLEKQCFTMTTKMVNECKFILDCLDVTWTTAPKGIEAEHVCAELTNTYDLDFGCDAVLSTDIDTLIYGAQQLVREISVKRKKILQLYSLDDIFIDNHIDMEDLKKIAVILGTDHALKTPGIGPGTVLKKYEDVELTNEQTDAVKVFEKECDVTELKFSNDFGFDEIGQGKQKLTKLINWLESKSFNRRKLIIKLEKTYTDQDNKLV